MIVLLEPKYKAISPDVQIARRTLENIEQRQRPGIHIIKTLLVFLSICTSMIIEPWFAIMLLSWLCVCYGIYTVIN